jgi:hypothetical protein
MRNAYKILVRNSERNRSRRRWEDNIIIDLREILWDGAEWIYVAQDKGQ